MDPRLDRSTGQRLLDVLLALDVEETNPVVHLVGRVKRMFSVVSERHVITAVLFARNIPPELALWRSETTTTTQKYEISQVHITQQDRLSP
jgi:hypothetical protein